MSSCPLLSVSSVVAAAASPPHPREGGSTAVALPITAAPLVSSMAFHHAAFVPRKNNNVYGSGASTINDINNNSETLSYQTVVTQFLLVYINPGSKSTCLNCATWSNCVALFYLYLTLHGCSF